MNHLLTRLTILLLIVTGFNQTVFSQDYHLLLGRPTDVSITVSVLFDQNAEFYLEYGTAPGIYNQSTFNTVAMNRIPEEVELTGLNPNTRYYYRMLYKFSGATVYTSTPEYSFHTQRPPGEPFTFTIEADEHLYDKKGVDNMYRITLANQAADQPDFMLSLGDIFGDDHEALTITSGALDSLHYNYRPFLGEICHSIPFYVCLGNHEGENDYYYSITPPNNLCIMGTQWRKHYFPNPYPNSFYSGNTDLEAYGIGNPENYYAWTWGDALFVVLDVYRDQCDTSPKPKEWNWSLGFPQYTWLKNTLESSTSRYKFVFAHHVRGQGRGGIEEAQLYEWGGKEARNGLNTFTINRPGWDKPIQQLFHDTGVNIFFQGHDHVFAHEVLDSVMYLAVPMAADSTYEIGMLANADAYVSDTIDGTGHIRVQVSPDCIQVDYVKAYLPADTISGLHHNREIGFSTSVGSCSAVVIGSTETPAKYSIYPIPADQLLKVRNLTEENNNHISILDLMGKIVYDGSEETIDVSGLSDGMYIMQIITNKKSFTQKLVIRHS